MLKMLNKFRYWLAALAVCAVPAAALAEGETSTAFSTALSDLQDGVTNMIDSIVPVVAAILVALLVFVGLFMAWRYVKKAAK